VDLVFHRARAETIYAKVRLSDDKIDGVPNMSAWIHAVHVPLPEQEYFACTLHLIH
jgi:hypothetical protein